MRPTIKYIEERFREFNRRIFGDRLPLPAIILTNARTYAAKVIGRRSTRYGCSTWQFELRVSVTTDKPADTIDDIIIHEMIHLHIMAGGLHDDAPHGRIFRDMMYRINRLHGRNISVSHRPDMAETESDRGRRPHIVCTATFRDGRTGFLQAASTRIFDLDFKIANSPDIAAHTWALSHNPFFNRYRRAMSLRFYIVDPDTLRRQLEGAKRLRICDGRIIAE